MTELILRARQQPYFPLWAAGLACAVGLVIFGLRQWATQDTLGFAWNAVLGLLLLVAILFQYALLFVRHMRLNKHIRRQYTLHRWVGCATLFLYALHAVRFGHAWTLVLSATFLLLAVSGIFHKEVVRYKSKRTYFAWLGLHIVLSIALLPLIAVHVWVALMYEGAG